MLRLRIRTKFIFMGAIGFFTLASIVILAYNMGRLGIDSIDRVFKDSKNVQSLQQNFIAPVFYLRELSLSLVVAPNEDFRKDIEETIDPLVATIDSNIQTLSKPINEAWQEYKEQLNQSRVYIDEGFEEGAFINVNTKERDQFYTLVSTLQEAQSEQLNASSQTYLDAKERIGNTHWTIIGASMLLSLLSLGLGWLVIRKIALSVEQVKLGLLEFFDFLKQKTMTQKPIAIGIDTNDELGDMAQAINLEINEAKNALRQDMQFIESATQMLQSLKEGNLQSRLESSAKTKELNTLKDVINQMVDDLENKIQQEITQRTDQEKLLIQQSRLAAMGNMIGNIAHQWRQPLGEINAILMNLETRYKFKQFDEDFLERCVKECNAITAYMSNTITDFQNFFKPSKTKEVFNIIEACKKAGNILASSLKYHEISLQWEIPKPQSALGYPNEFSQAFLNILSNAKDVLIQRQIPKPCICITITSGEQYILIKVQDNGGGIVPENMERIFEPYFTTKHAKQGTGIGLYMAKTIIEHNMDGYLNAINYPNGACFTIKLPKFNP
jgi:signal transduction histidine kinase